VYCVWGGLIPPEDESLCDCLIGCVAGRSGNLIMAKPLLHVSHHQLDRVVSGVATGSLSSDPSGGFLLFAFQVRWVCDSTSPKECAMINLPRLSAYVTTVAIVASALVAGHGTAQAVSVAGFRLSQFGAFVARVCVHTDADYVCTGNWGAGRSEVFNVKYNSLGSFQCGLKISGTDRTAESVRFSRLNWKECAARGVITGPWVEVKPVPR
jgi:hypothetical protein